MKNIFTIGLAQLSVESNAMNNNLMITEEWFSKAKASSCDLLVFPEIHLNLFFPQYENRQDLAVPIEIDSEEIHLLRSYAKQYKMNCIPNVYLKEDSACYDASIAIDHFGEIQSIAKMAHIAQQNKFYEQDYYTPSNEHFKVVDFNGCKVGIIICFDRHYPESYRACVQQGADLIVIPTANTKDEPMDVFEAEIKAAAFQNSVAIAMANRFGLEDEMHFSGESLVVMSDGKVLNKAGNGETLLVSSIDIDQVKSDRLKSPYNSLNRFNLEFKL